MNEGPDSINEKETPGKLDELIQKKREEIAGLQRLLLSIENPILPKTNPLPDKNEKENNHKSSE